MQFWATLHSQAGALRPAFILQPQVQIALKSSTPLPVHGAHTHAKPGGAECERLPFLWTNFVPMLWQIPGDYSPINSRPKRKQQCWKWWDSQQNETCGLSLGILLDKTVPNPKNDATASCDTGGACNFAGRSLFCTEHRQSSNTCTWRTRTSCPSFTDCLHESSVPTRCGCIPGPSSCPAQLSVDLAVFQQCTLCTFCARCKSMIRLQKWWTLGILCVYSLRNPHGCSGPPAVAVQV